MTKLYRTVLVDDEPLALRRLRELLAEYPRQFTVVGEATNGQVGRERIDSLQPDVVFLDIEMPVLNGLQLVQQLIHVPLIVFVTAYDEYAIRAFEENSIDYLLKPVEKERLDRTVQKLNRLTDRPSLAGLQQQLAQLLQHNRQVPDLSVVPVRIGDRTLLIRLDEVSYFEAEDRYVNLISQTGDKYLIDYSLAMLEERLPPTFLRVSRSVIVNRERVREVQRYLAGRYILLLNDKAKSRITSGPHYADAVKTLIHWR